MSEARLGPPLSLRRFDHRNFDRSNDGPGAANGNTSGELVDFYEKHGQSIHALEHLEFLAQTDADSSNFFKTADASLAFTSSIRLRRSGLESRGRSLQIEAPAN